MSAATEKRAPRWHVRDAGAADFEALRTSMLDILRETEGQKSAGFDRRFWEWQYLDLPGGSLIVVADDDGRIAGYYHVLLCGMRHRGRVLRGAMVQDVATLAAYRGQGMFRAMGGGALESMRQREIDFIYTFPNSKSLPSFVRDHAYAVAGRVPVYVRPLDAGRLLADRARLGAVGRALGAVARPFVGPRAARFAAGERIVRVTACDAAIERVAEEFAASVTVGLDRTAAYLDWRFLQKPTHEYTIWGLERDGRLSAYLVTRRGGLFGTECVILMDLGHATGEEDALARLIGSRLADEAAHGAALAVTIGLHPFFARLRRLGFVRVPERWNPRPFNLATKPLTSAAGPELLDPGSWLITLADWDVL